tara:strand:- start:11643 stop:12572 length:930 start_codon:yes stop_codon:yes gene_type:complete
VYLRKKFRKFKYKLMFWWHRFFKKPEEINDFFIYEDFVEPLVETKKRLFATGCSFTDVYNYSSPWYKEFKYTTSWPEEVIKQLRGDWSFYNGAGCGLGNDAICATFFDHVTRVGNPDFVMIQWSGAGRVPIGYPKDCKLNKTLHLDPIAWYNSQHSKKDMFQNPEWRHDQAAILAWSNKYKKIYYPHRHIKFGIDNWYKNIYIVQDYCKMHDIPYIFGQGINTLQTTSREDNYMIMEYIENHHMYDQIDQDKFIGWPTLLDGFCFGEYFKKNPELIIGELDTHPNNDGTIKIAEWYLEKVKENYENFIR